MEYFSENPNSPAQRIWRPVSRDPKIPRSRLAHHSIQLLEFYQTVLKLFRPRKRGRNCKPSKSERGQGSDHTQCSFHSRDMLATPLTMTSPSHAPATRAGAEIPAEQVGRSPPSILMRTSNGYNSAHARPTWAACSSFFLEFRALSTTPFTNPPTHSGAELKFHI